MSKQKYKILVIDDSAEDRTIFRHFLQNDKDVEYSFLEAELGENGIEICLTEMPDCVLLDYKLPDTDGLAVAKILNPDPANPVFPVILLTGRGDERLAVKAIKNGVQDYLVKGKITPEELRWSISKAVEVVGLRQERRQTLEDLLLSESRLKIGIEVADFAICEIDYINNTNHLSQTAAKMFGLGDEEMTVSREAVHATFHPEDAAAIMRDIAESLDPDGAGWFAQEHRVVWKNGETRWLSVRKQIFFDHKSNPPRPVRGILATRDVTEQRLAEEQLHENQLFIQNVVATAPTVFYIFSLKTQSPTYLTSQAATVLGYSFDEVKDEQADFLRVYMHPDDAKSAEKHFQQVSQLPTEEVSEFEYRMRHKSGEWRWFRSRDKVFKRDKNDEPTEILGIATDITEHKKAADELRESDERTRLATDATGVGIWEWNVITNQIRWDAQMFRIYGIGPTKDGFVPYSAWSESVVPDELQRQEELLRETLDQRGHGSRNFQIRRASDAKIRLIQAVETIRLNAEGNVEWVLGTNLDITESNEREENLRESEERFRVLFDSIDEGFCIVEMIFDENSKPIDYRFIQVNPAMERLTGLKNVLGKTARELIPDLEEFWFETYGRIALTDNPERFESEAVSMNRWFEVYASRVRDSTSRVAIVFNNITDRKLAEQERQESFKREQILRREAEHANIAKDEFLAVLSHELRSPLNAMLGWATMLNKGGLDEKTQKQALQVIERNIRLQNSLIEDLLDVSRIISGKMRLEPEKISFVSLVQNAVESARPAATAKTVKIEMMFDSAADEMFGDSHRLHQVIGNLMTNAIKFTPESGTINVDLNRNGDTARLLIKDNGIGISKELLPHVFERFQRADGSSKRQYGGLGLGLTIVKHLVEMHDGQVSAESDGEGKGTTFIVELPLIKIYRAIETRSAKTSTDKNEENSTSKPLENIKILVVDDYADVLDLTRFVLTKKGAEVTCALSAEEAIRELEAKKFDLLISDLGMAGTDGYDLIQHVRGSENREVYALPAIAVTGYVSADDRQRVFEAGFQKHLPKPLDIDNLPAIVLELVGERK